MKTKKDNPNWPPKSKYDEPTRKCEQCGFTAYALSGSLDMRTMRTTHVCERPTGKLLCSTCCYPMGFGHS